MAQAESSAGVHGVASYAFPHAARGTAQDAVQADPEDPEDAEYSPTTSRSASGKNSTIPSLRGCEGQMVSDLVRRRCHKPDVVAFDSPGEDHHRFFVCPEFPRRNTGVTSFKQEGVPMA